MLISKRFSHHDGPYFRLIVAINHYISTGTYLGEGGIHEEESEIHVIVPMMRDDPQDSRDFEALRSRLIEIEAEHGTSLEYYGPLGDNRYDGWAIRVPNDQIEAFTYALMRQPGPLGWGSQKAVIDGLLEE